MSADKLTESDSLPDRGSEVSDKPFPGAPADREPAAKPGPQPSMEQMQAAYDSAGSIEDIAAAAEADEAAAARGSESSSEGSDPASEVPASAGSGSSDVAGTSEVPGPSAGGDVPGTEPGVQDGAAGPGTAVPDGPSDGRGIPEEAGQPEGTARPERTDVPAFPGAPRDREPAPEPEPSPSMEQMRAAYDRSSNIDELRAAAQADEDAAKEAAAAKGSAAARPGGDAGASQDVSSRDAAADDSGEQQGEEADGQAAEEAAPEQPVVLRAPQQEMPAAEAPDGESAPLGRQPDTVLDGQQDVPHEDVVVPDQVEEAEGEPALEGADPAKDGVTATRSDATTAEADDGPVVVQGVVEPDRPEAAVSPEEGDAGDANASRSEVRLDTQSDDQRPVTRAEMMAMVAEAKAEMAAENEAKLEAIETRHKAEIDAKEAENQELKQKTDALEGKLDTILQMLQGSSDQAPESREQATLQEGTQTEEGQAASSPEKQPDSTHAVEQLDPADAPVSSDVSERRREDVATADRMEPEHPRRKWFTIDNASAVGSVAGFGASVAGIFAHIPPEVAAGPAAIGAFAGIMGSTIMKTRRNKQRD